FDVDRLSEWLREASPGSFVEQGTRGRGPRQPDGDLAAAWVLSQKVPAEAAQVRPAQAGGGPNARQAEPLAQAVAGQPPPGPPPPTRGRHVHKGINGSDVALRTDKAMPADLDRLGIAREGDGGNIAGLFERRFQLTGDKSFVNRKMVGHI